MYVPSFDAKAASPETQTYVIDVQPKQLTSIKLPVDIFSWKSEPISEDEPEMLLNVNELVNGKELQEEKLSASSSDEEHGSQIARSPNSSQQLESSPHSP